MCILRLITGNGAALVLAASLLSAEEAKKPSHTDWPSFRGNLAQTGVAASPLPEQLDLVWEATVGDQVVATCAVVGDGVYVPCLSGELVCLDRRNGKPLWSYQSVDMVEPNSIAPGFKSSPTVADGTVYLGDEDGVFHAIDAETGKGRWKFKTEGEIYSCAAVVDGRVLFGSYDNCLYCLKQDDGELLWKFETQGYVHCSPAVVEGRTFIAGCDEHLRIIDVASGRELADLPLQTYLIASPAIVGDHLYVGTYGSEVAAVDWRKVEQTWRKRTGDAEAPIHSSAAVTDEFVVVGGRDKTVTALDRKTGKKVWSFVTRGKVDSSPVIVGDRVFVGSHDGNLYELSLAQGKERWKFNAGKPISAGPAVAAGMLIIGSESRDGKVYCFGDKKNP
jgi:outer membrane protein assembly factor BamB